MRTIIAGSRTLSKKHVQEALSKCGWVPSFIISGVASGVDTHAIEIAKELGIEYKVFPANWAKYGKSAGYIRNSQMITEGNAQALIAVWDGKSRGTEGMIKTAKSKKLTIYVTDVASIS